MAGIAYAAAMLGFSLFYTKIHFDTVNFERNYKADMAKRKLERVISFADQSPQLCHTWQMTRAFESRHLKSEDRNMLWDRYFDAFGKVVTVRRGMVAQH